MMWVLTEYSAYSAQLCGLDTEILEITDARMWYFKWYSCLSSLNCDTFVQSPDRDIRFT